MKCLGESEQGVHSLRVHALIFLFRNVCVPVCKCFFVFRKELYQSVFQYRTPLYHPEQAKFDFREPHKWPTENPWKESFRQLVSLLYSPVDRTS